MLGIECAQQIICFISIQTIIRGHQNGHLQDVSVARSNSLRRESPPPYRRRAPGSDYPTVPEEEVIHQTSRHDYAPHHHPANPPHLQHKEQFQQQVPTGYRERRDYPGEYPQPPRDNFDARDSMRSAQPHRHSQQEQVDPRTRMPKHDGHRDFVDHRGEYRHGTIDRRPVHHDPRVNSSYDSHTGDRSFEYNPQGQSLRHSHYDDRSLPHQNNDRYRQVPNGIPQPGPPRHQSIPPAHQDHPNYASISQSPAALQFERVSIFEQSLLTIYVCARYDLHFRKIRNPFPCLQAYIWNMLLAPRFYRPLATSSCQYHRGCLYLP